MGTPSPGTPRVAANAHSIHLAELPIDQLSVRALLASQAMVGHLSNTGDGQRYGGFKSAASLAKACVQCADALIDELSSQRYIPCVPDHDADALGDDDDRTSAADIFAEVDIEMRNAAAEKKGGA